MKQDVKKFGICRLVGWKVAGVVLVVLAMGGCSDAGSEGEGDEGVALRVDGGIVGLARASEDTWEKGDAIGVYMLDGATTGEVNRKYVTGETAKAGSFEAAEGETIYLPSDGTARDFTAYYPYQGDLKDGVYIVDVREQDPQRDIDLMVADKVTGVTKKAPGVGFVFRHKLVKLDLTIRPDGKSLSAADLEGMVVRITNQQVRVKCKVAEGGTIEIINITGGVTLLTAADGTRAEGIVLPSASTDAMFFWFELKNGSEYRWYLKDSPLSKEFVAGNKYVYTMTIGKRSVEVTSTVVGWTAGNGDGGETGFAE